ncbi:hypothetical protein BGX30_003385 [Mortierella sp. GBA39]|nr:hypothetical protein BGX30_003385 [Mortierella sp. GBA39]
MEPQEATNRETSEGKLSSSLEQRLAEFPEDPSEDDDALESGGDEDGRDERDEDGVNNEAVHDDNPSFGEDIAGANNTTKVVREEGVEEFRMEQPGEKQRSSAISRERNVLQVIRDSLFNDPYIIETAETYEFSEDKRIVMHGKWGACCLSFYLKAEFFVHWLKRHSECIGTTFSPRNGAYHYSTNVKENSTQRKKDIAGQVVYRYSCHCKSKKYEPKNRVKGGKSGKTRQRLDSVLCHCRSSLNATFRPKPTGDGMPGDTYTVEYLFEHNHKLGDAENIGTMRKSEAIKLRIKAMLMRGMSINAIMDQLTMDHAKFARFLDGKESMPLSRDNFVTYEDVYNILYAITAKEVRKSDDDTVSARLWMEELDKDDYFTFYDKESDLYHGFASPWQLDQLRRWGDTFLLRWDPSCPRVS